MILAPLESLLNVGITIDPHQDTTGSGTNRDPRCSDVLYM